MSSDLKLTFSNDQTENHHNYRNRVTPFANSQIYFASIQSAQELTDGEDVKIIYKLTLNSTGVTHQFFPGDSIGVLPQNNDSVIEKVLLRLNIESEADKACKVQISPQSVKKFQHLPPQSSVRDIFRNHVDIHTPPKKLFLKSLAKFVEDPEDLIKIQRICAPKASKEYQDFITGPGATLLGLLENFPSCRPPVEVILEHLPPLQPRFYSISSSPLLENKLELTFFVMECSGGRKGVCTGWLEHLIKDQVNFLLPFYFRQPTRFRLPENLTSPVILVATGTGIAPIRGFLQHRSLLGSGTDGDGKIWLLYGCRYSDRDCLYKDEINKYLQEGVLTRVNLAFSREGEVKNYVQHDIERHGGEFIDWLLKKDALIFVCGDAKTMVRDVKASVVKNLVKFGGMSESDADYFMKEMQSREKFVVDTWI